MLPRAMRAWKPFLIAATLAAVPMLAKAGPPDADPAYAVGGWWDSPTADNWPLNPLHMALMTDGRVLSFGSNGDGFGSGYLIYDVWDPSAGLGGGHVTLPNVTSTDIYCSAAVIIPGSGDILIAGGDQNDGTGTTQLGTNRSTIFRTADTSLTRGPDMRRGRWYGSVTPLLNGEIYVQGGNSGEKRPEVRRRDGTFRLLDGAGTGSLEWWYPRTFLTPDGKIFGYDGSGDMFRVDTAGAGSISMLGAFDSSLKSTMSTAAMFAPYKVLQVSGISDKAGVIDFSGPVPVVTQTGRLSSRRAWATATVLPNGRVLVTGGSVVPNTLTGVNNHAEIWDPATGRWTVGPEGARPRLYHSSALLLTDGTVLVGGGGSTPNSPVTNLHAEIYYPPYLFDAAGKLAARPTIEAAPEILPIAGTVSIQAGGAGVVQRVTLIRASHASHSLNNIQNFVELPFTAEGGAISARMPVNPADAPPGYYLLFVINQAGVPSRARIARINPQPTSGADGTAPSAPGSLALSKSNGWAKLDWGASSDNVGVAGYAIHRSTGNSVGPQIKQVSGTRTWTDTTAQEGTKYWYAVKAYDAAGNVSGASPLKSIVPFKVPTQPTNFSLKLTNNKPQLNFTRSTDNVGVVGYNVYRSTTGNMGALYAQISGPGWINVGAQKGKTYTYAVRARDAAGYLSSPTVLKTITSQ